MLPCTCTCIYTVVRLAQLLNNEAMRLNFDIHMHMPHVHGIENNCRVYRHNKKRLAIIF